MAIPACSVLKQVIILHQITIMKKLLLFACTTLIAGTLLTITSCKKNDDDPVCRLSTATNVSSSGNSALVFSYNTDGKLSQMVSTGASSYTRTFSYSGNTINIIQRDGANAIVQTSDVTLNNANKVVSIVTKSAAGTVTEMLNVDYDANGNASRIIAKYGSGTPDTSILTYSGGDLITITSGTSITTLTYYTDKAFQPGDYLYYTQMMQYGAMYITNQHMLKSYQNSGGTPSNFTYEYDNSGNVSKITLISGSTTESLDYTYNCN